jgi:predicted GIY-YIG superfamily endonuclease
MPMPKNWNTQDRIWFVYWLNAADGSCLYVGITGQPEKRWYHHCHQRPEMTQQVAFRKMRGPFTLLAARRIERMEQDRLLPKCDGQRKYQARRRTAQLSG